jgi:hypothetical protein
MSAPDVKEAERKHAVVRIDTRDFKRYIARGMSTCGNCADVGAILSGYALRPWTGDPVVLACAMGWIEVPA